MAEWTFKGEAKRLEDIDLPRIGKMIGVGEDELHAFMDVEAAGSGFDSQGRPKILFEPHIFYRLLGPGKTRNKAVAQGLAYAKWKKTGYPKDSYDRLRKAMAINSTLALMSASWGAFQIMGFNHGAAGYATPEEMVRDFMADEDNHVEAAVRFIANKKLDDDLRAHRWEVIEDVYNGGGFGGAYARKMRAAYARWQKIKDTPLPAPELAQEAPSPSPAPTPVENPASPQGEQPASTGKPSAGQVGGSVVIGAGGVAAAVGVPWHWVAIVSGLVLAGLVAFIVFRNRKRSA